MARTPSEARELVGVEIDYWRELIRGRLKAKGDNRPLTDSEVIVAAILASASANLLKGGS